MGYQESNYALSLVTTSESNGEWVLKRETCITEDKKEKKLS